MSFVAAFLLSLVAMSLPLRSAAQEDDSAAKQNTGASDDAWKHMPKPNAPKLPTPVTSVQHPPAGPNNIKSPNLQTNDASKSDDSEKASSSAGPSGPEWVGKPSADSPEKARAKRIEAILNLLRKGKTTEAKARKALRPLVAASLDLEEDDSAVKDKIDELIASTKRKHGSTRPQ